MFMEELILFYNKHKNATLCSWKLKPQFLKLCQLTSFLPEDSSISQRIWHIKNNTFELQHCVICGTIVQFNVKKGKYFITCCEKCKKEHKLSENYQNKRKETSIKRYGVEHYSQTKEFKNTIQFDPKTFAKKYNLPIK